MFLLMWEGFWALFFLVSSEARLLCWFCNSFSACSLWDEVVEVECCHSPSSPCWTRSLSKTASRDWSAETVLDQIVQNVLVISFLLTLVINMDLTERIKNFSVIWPCTLRSIGNADKSKLSKFSHPTTEVFISCQTTAGYVNLLLDTRNTMWLLQ